jgi:hypothetical protein
MQRASLETLPAELLTQISTPLDLPGVWLSSRTLLTLGAASRNPVIAPQIKHIDFNVLYLDIINEWTRATSSKWLALPHSQIHAFVEKEKQFFEREDFEDVLGRQLEAFPALSSITTKSKRGYLR